MSREAWGLRTARACPLVRVPKSKLKGSEAPQWSRLNNRRAAPPLVTIKVSARVPLAVIRMFDFKYRFIGGLDLFFIPIILWKLLYLDQWAFYTPCFVHR